MLKHFFWMTAWMTVSIGAFASSVDNNIGKVQLLLGQEATLIRDGEAQPVMADVGLREGDTLETGPATHIHLKMNDGAYIALRPQSELKIECYQSNPEKNLCMKFDLKKGNMRAVSGKGSHSDPQKYRLNTPVAAIGVRGTDFVTQIQNGSTLVRVLEGAITVTPYSEMCQASTLGNCSTELTGLLTQDDTFMLKAMPGTRPQQIALSHNMANRSDVLEQQSREKVAQEATKFGDVVQILKDDPELVQKYLELAGYSNQQDFDPQDKPDLSQSQVPLMFGTWNDYSVGIARPYDEAREGRMVTVGNAAGALWRADGVYQPPSGKLDYNLTDSSAYIVTPNSAVIGADVTDGALSINFDKNELKTHINILPDDGRAINFSATHQLNRTDGVFAIGGDEGRIAAGAISNDGQQVGYMINAPVEQGRLNAQTLWQAQ
ncbi:hypothetical protein AVO42_11580 [Thiomicrospira sp. XS5]|uniref:FecR family protein n=1 Tax=Thiomicrospira sp. XS5 TaxID=1775636 RepID=UPI000747A469|nr:FecR domain-containing protein [Thiomicrospira sp. XS5]KUJ75907.1 hypothetical protein AVO42_11580 [Thiomicrospira sp. XS5]